MSEFEIMRMAHWSRMYRAHLFDPNDKEANTTIEQAAAFADQDLELFDQRFKSVETVSDVERRTGKAIGETHPHLFRAGFNGVYVGDRVVLINTGSLNYGQKGMLKDVTQDGDAEVDWDQPGIARMVKWNNLMGEKKWDEDYCDHCHGPCRRKPRHGETGI